MPDRPVKGLIFEVCDGPNVHFDRADPLLCDERDFRVRVESGKATFEFKVPYETESEARKAVKDYIDQWEFLAGLQHGSHAFRFRFENPVYAEEELDSGGVLVRGGTRHSIEAGGELSVINHPRAYPTPPSGVKITPDVGRMFHRYLGYRENKEPLASMAYYCLTVLDRSVPQHATKNTEGMANPSTSNIDVQDWFCVSRNVHSRLKRLSSGHGGLEARKADGTGKDLKPEEKQFLEEGIKRIIRRMAEKAYDPFQPLQQITLADLPLLRKGRSGQSSEPPMPCDQKTWKEVPKEQWADYCSVGEQLKRTAADLHSERLKMTGPDFVGTLRDPAVGYMISATILQPLAAEYLLKGLSVREHGMFRPIHNLQELYSVLSSSTRTRIAEIGTSQADLDMPEFLKIHRNDFVTWRYPLEGIDREFSFARFDKALDVLIAALNA